MRLGFGMYNVLCRHVQGNKRFINHRPLRSDQLITILVSKISGSQATKLLAILDGTKIGQKIASISQRLRTAPSDLSRLKTTAALR
jgi:hypothetical protein